MSKHKHIDRICCIALAVSVLIAILFMNGEVIGIKTASNTMGYESRLFDTAAVHTIDIVMDDWDEFVENCESEEYSVCSAVIDGEAYTNIGIRAKGNTSLSSVAQMDSDRYSFKIEFDHYDSTKSYYGLDKLSLNNLIQDNTYMKDYLVYQMMREFGADAPLCSYVYITVNGEDWGLYLAVEGIEDAFLQRNYGSDYGELYKPDSLSFGGGRGNGKNFDIEDFDFSSAFSASDADNITLPDVQTQQNENKQTSESAGGEMPEDFDPSSMFGGQMPQNGDAAAKPDSDTESSEKSSVSHTDQGDLSTNKGKSFFGGMSGMGSDDVKLKYIDDDPDSYSNIFSSAKTDVTDADKTRLIESLKVLSEGEDIEDVVDIDEVIRYFVVHNFVVNGDSYTGSMVHNYYLYEEDGQLSMIPWDYNLAFGTFMGSDASESVNEPIDSPVSGGNSDDRPMIAWIFGSEEYTELYHQYFSEFIENVFESGYFSEMVDSVTELISPYVREDPTKFCTYEEFEQGVQTIKEFCLLRAQSVSGQLNGTVPSTLSGQSENPTALVDASSISISAMGTMGSSMGGGFGGRDNFTTFDVSRSDMTEPQSGSDKTPSQMSDSDIRQKFSGRKDKNISDRLSGDIPQGAYAGDSQGTAQWTVLAVSVAVLTVGLLIAIFFKRQKSR